MSGEVDTRPDLVKQIQEMRDRIRELERRIQGDEAGLDLSDLNDVRVDSMVDGGVTLADGSTLLYRASDKLWYAGPGASILTNSYYEFIDDGTTTGKTQTAGDVENKWDAVFAVGSDVSLSSGKVIFDTTGVYSIAATWLVKANTAADLYNYARGRFTLERSNEPGGTPHGFVFLDDVKMPAVNSSDNKHIASFAVTIVAFMYAGDDVICETRFESSGTAGSTWSIVTASMYVERLA